MIGYSNVTLELYYGLLVTVREHCLVIFNLVQMMRTTPELIWHPTQTAYRRPNAWTTTNLMCTSPPLYGGIFLAEWPRSSSPDHGPMVHGSMAIFADLFFGINPEPLIIAHCVAFQQCYCNQSLMNLYSIPRLLYNRRILVLNLRNNDYFIVPIISKQKDKRKQQFKASVSTEEQR